MSKVEDKSDLLHEPLHGIYIPAALIVIGTVIIDYQYLPYTLAFLGIIVGYRFFNAFSEFTSELFSMLHTNFSQDRRQSLHPENWRSLELIDKTVISRNTAIYRFQLVRDSETLNIPIGHHVAVQLDNEIRYYTPISSKFDKGFFDILVKSYPDGNVSKQFASLNPGKSLKFRGPVGRFHYATNHVKEIGLIAGGSGITPILQVISEVTTTPEDVTKLSLIYANETENDILLKEELDELASKYPNFEVHYVLNKPPQDWAGETGYVTKEIVDKYLPKPSDDSRILICGPQGMKTSLINITEELGFTKAKMPSKGDDQVFIF